MSESNSKLLGILKRMVFYSQISAAYPFHEPFKSTLCYKLCLVYQLVVFLCHNIISLEFVRSLKLDSKNSNDNILLVLALIVSLIMTCAADVNVTMILRRRRLLTHVFGRMEALHVRLEMLGCRPHYSTSWKFCIFGACPFAISIAILLGTSKLLSPIHLIFVSSSALATARLFSGLLGILTEQLRCLRTEVASSTPDIFGVVIFSDLHGCATSTCQSVSRVFANQMLTILTTSSFFVVINTHYFLRCVYVRIFSVTHIVVRTLWTFAYIFLGYSIVNACVTVRHEVKEFNILLYQLMINDRTNEITNNKKLRLHVAMNREVVFAAFGFFNLDYNLVHSMIAVATTYLVILIQFNIDPTTTGAPTTDPTSQSTNTTLPLFLTTPS